MGLIKPSSLSDTEKLSGVFKTTTQIYLEVIMVAKVRVVQYGCGPVGCAAVRYAAERPDLEIVGAIDVDENLVGKDLGEVAGIEKLGVIISADAAVVLSQSGADVALHTVSSSLKVTRQQIETCAAAGVHVVSSCEEMSFPYRQDPQTAAKIDKLAKEGKITALSTGVNPGFLMDAWPIFMTGVCQQVKRVKVVRIQNASSRRGPFQKKIGAGRTPEEFAELVASGTLKHVGLPESLAMIASALGWELDDITESIEPVMATAPVKTDFADVQLGQAVGVRQVGRGFRNGEELITLEFEAAVGAPESYDAVYITGIPNLEVVVKGGVHGDVATAAMLVNSIPRVIQAPPGLVTMKDMSIVSALGLGLSV
jgi:4-hydroxy-tetrahydrodipicolinate reductase